jgi:hypothetical protein
MNNQDDLISRAAAIEAFDDERVDRNYGDVSPESVIEVIESIPAVEAIPVTWIFEQEQILHELHNKNEYVLQWIIELWQKEQEAQDG